MYKTKQPFSSIPPTVTKKFATDKGNANKDIMYESFIKEPDAPQNLKTILRPKSTKLTGPTTDIVDSYWICKYGWKELFGQLSSTI